MTIKDKIFASYKLSLGILIVLHCFVFLGIAWLLLPNMDIDMFENYAWGQTLTWGSFKHPPFFAWVTHAWFQLMPTNHVAYFVLSYFNVAIALVGILYLASLLLKEGIDKQSKQVFLFRVLGFCILALPYNVYAAIFNADSVSLSLWPWTSLAFFSCLKTRGKKQICWTLALACLAAACVLGKYFSIVLLLTLAVISFSEKQYRSWYKTVSPYLCLLLFLLLLVPHLLWEYGLNFPFRVYVAHYVASSYIKMLSHLLTFGLTGFYFFAFSWFVWFVLRQKTPLTSGLISNRLLLLLCLLPLGITWGLSLLLGISIMDRWAIPLWFALPLWMANQLAIKKKGLGVFAYSWFALVGLILLFCGYTFFVSHSYLSKHHDYLEARKAMVKRVAWKFHRLFPGEEIAWVAGSVWPDHLAPFTYYLHNHPPALPGFPDQMPALVNPYSDWSSTSGLLVCGKKFADNWDLVNQCVGKTREWLAANHLPVYEEVIEFRAKGWRWEYQPGVKRKVVIFYIPKIRQN